MNTKIATRIHGQISPFDEWLFKATQEEEGQKQIVGKPNPVENFDEPGFLFLLV